MKSVLFAAAMSVAALPAAAFDINDMSAEERAAFGAQVRSYLLENPEVILEAYQIYEARQAETKAAGDIAMVQANRDEIFNQSRDWVGGNPAGDLTLVEFMDYRCGYCRKAHDEVAELIETDGNIRFVVKEFPILGEESVLSSRFAIATKLVAGAEAYKNMHDSLIKFRGNITETSLKKLANTLGYDGAAILEQLNNPAVNEELAANQQLAKTMSINGTPTFILEDHMLRGYVPLANMIDIVAEVRASE